MDFHIKEATDFGISLNLAHIEKIKQLLQRLQDVGLMVNTKKCSFAQPEFEILGHICSGDGVSPNSKKVSAILDYLMPEDRPALH